MHSSSMPWLYSLVCVQLSFHEHVEGESDSLIHWISDTHSQGYTDLQSLVKCLDHMDIILGTGESDCNLDVCRLLSRP